MSKDVITNAVEENSGAVIAKEEKTPKSKKSKAPVKKDNFFKRIWKKLVKLCKDTVGEMKKVVWTPKHELKKNTKLVLVTVIAIGIVIAVFDTLFSYFINTFAGMIG